VRQHGWARHWATRPDAEEDPGRDRLYGRCARQVSECIRTFRLHPQRAPFKVHATLVLTALHSRHRRGTSKLDADTSDEPVHVLIRGPTEEAVAKAKAMVDLLIDFNSKEGEVRPNMVI
jgi:hypothetical protein